MKIHFHEAAGDMTSAAFQLTTERARTLVDRGLYQGGREIVAKNRVVPEACAGLTRKQCKRPGSVARS
jgi:hypothetical protein